MKRRAMRVRRHVPNALSVSRLAVATLALPACKEFGTAFWSYYVAVGISDAADGALARHWGVTSAVGSKLDSLADVAVAVYFWRRILPHLPLSHMHSRWAVGIVGAKLMVGAANTLAGNKLDYHHNANRVTGLLAYSVPVARFSPRLCSVVATIACLSATVAVVHEARALYR